MTDFSLSDPFGSLRNLAEDAYESAGEAIDSATELVSEVLTSAGEAIEEVFTSDTSEEQPSEASRRVARDISHRPAVNHPILCRELPSDTSAMSAEEFNAFFECRMQEINDHIEAGEIEDASRMIRETNTAWRSFNSAHREIPQSERNAYLGHLYLARARIEATRGEARDLQRTYYEARGYDLTGDHARARLRYRQVMAMPAPATRSRQVMEIGRVSTERRQALELEAVDRIESQMGVILETRTTRLGENFLVPRNREDLSFFVSSARTLIESGRADTVDEAIAIMRDHHRHSRSDFESHGVRRGWTVRAWRGMGDISVHGGVLEFIGPQNPQTRRITIGREGGVIVNTGASYHFPPSDHERVIEVHSTTPYYRNDAGRLIRIGPNSAICRRSASGDVPETVTRHYELNERGRYTGLIHPQSFDAFLNADGSNGGDPIFWSVVGMETETGMTRLTDPDQRNRYLVELGQTIGVRGGSFLMAGMLMEEVFEDEFGSALSEVSRPRGSSESLEDYQAAMMEAAGERMQEWMDSGELRRRDPEAARAWETYNDIHDVAGEWFNISEENWALFQDQVMLLAITLPVTLGVGAIAEGFAGAYIATDAVIAARAITLMGRFGPRIAAMSGRAAPTLVRGAVTTAVAAPAEAGTQVLQDRIYTGREITPSSFAHTALTFGAFRSVNTLLAGGGEVFAASSSGRALTAWAEGSLMREGALGAGRFGIHQGTMLGTATGLSYTSGSDSPFAERVGQEWLNLTLISMFSLIAPGRGGPRSLTPREAITVRTFVPRALTPNILLTTSADRLSRAETIAHLRLGSEDVPQSRFDQAVRDVLREWEGQTDWQQRYELERTTRIHSRADALQELIPARPTTPVELPSAEGVTRPGTPRARAAETPVDGTRTIRQPNSIALAERRAQLIERIVEQARRDHPEHFSGETGEARVAQLRTRMEAQATLTDAQLEHFPAGERGDARLMQIGMEFVGLRVRLGQGAATADPRPTVPPPGRARRAAPAPEGSGPRTVNVRPPQEAAPPVANPRFADRQALLIERIVEQARRDHPEHFSGETGEERVAQIRTRMEAQATLTDAQLEHFPAGERGDARLMQIGMEFVGLRVRLGQRSVADASADPRPTVPPPGRARRAAPAPEGSGPRTVNVRPPQEAAPPVASALPAPSESAVLFRHRTGDPTDTTHRIASLEVQVTADGDLVVRSAVSSEPVIVNGTEQPAGRWAALNEGDTVHTDGRIYARIRGELRQIHRAPEDAPYLYRRDDGLLPARILDNGDGNQTKIAGNGALNYEQQALALIQHVGITDFTPTLIGRVGPSELILTRLAGRSLDRLSPADRRAIPRSAWDQFGQNLQQLHEHGVFHNDIHSANILWDGQTLRLIDFGRARIRARASDPSRQIMGADDIRRLHHIRDISQTGGDQRSLAVAPGDGVEQAMVGYEEADIAFVGSEQPAPAPVASPRFSERRGQLILRIVEQARQDHPEHFSGETGEERVAQLRTSLEERLLQDVTLETITNDEALLIMARPFVQDQVAAMD